MDQYISKDALVAEIDRQKIGYNVDGKHSVEYDITRKIIDIINSLEVKEVDFDNDLLEEVYSHLDDIKETADRMTSGNFMHNRAAIKFSANMIEKVLGLIGLKAQKELREAIKNHFLT